MERRISTGAFALLAAAGLGLLGWTAARHAPVALALVAASLLLAAGSLWSCQALFGPAAALRFLALGTALGWAAEQAGTSWGWFFGDYTYTEVLGPKVGAVPAVIPLMWFGLTHVGLVLACLLLWRAPAPRTGWIAGGLTALLAAMLVTAFDLGADPYFVYQLQAWIMARKDGGWFGETLRGFAGWMVVGFAIVAAFLCLVRPRLALPADPVRLRRAALVPVVVYAGFLVFQLAVLQPLALRAVALFAMGIPLLVAAAGWWQWHREAGHAA